MLGDFGAALGATVWGGDQIISADGADWIGGLEGCAIAELVEDDDLLVGNGLLQGEGALDWAEDEDDPLFISAAQDLDDEIEAEEK